MLRHTVCVTASSCGVADVHDQEFAYVAYSLRCSAHREHHQKMRADRSDTLPLLRESLTLPGRMY